MKPRTVRLAKPELQKLDDRCLPTAGVSASLSHGVLSVNGTSTTSPIVVDVLATRSRRGVSGVVVVEGVANFKASQVRQVVVTSVAGEVVSVNPSSRWNPKFRYNFVNPVGTNPPSSNPRSPSQPITLPPGPSNPSPSPGNGSVSLSSTMKSDEQAIVEAVNQVRTQNGLAPLQVNGQLVQMAHLQANNMATYNTMSHTIATAPQPGLTDRAGYIGYSYSWLGENIAFNYGDTGSVMTAWMNSPGHRANILDPNFTQIGVGITLDSTGRPYYAQVFGKPSH